jgi:hypothetical protein
MSTQIEKQNKPVGRSYEGEMYQPLAFPMADHEDFANTCERIILRHEGCGKYREAKLIIAPKGLLYSGWVIGLHPEKQ